MNMKEIMSIKNLQKSFDGYKAVNDLSFKVNEGELFAFLGVNGAGKSTTISIICGVQSKDSGSVYINGKDIDKNMEDITSDLGIVFQNSVLDNFLSVYDNLLVRASLYGMSKKDADERINELAELLNFKYLLKREVLKLSGGERRRVDVARALIHKPKILILDEPTTGLDPMTRNNLWNIIDDLRKKEKMTVFLTTHYMEEASTADYIIILDKGKIICEGTPLELKNKYALDYITLYNVDLKDVKSLNLPFEEVRNGYRIKVNNTSVAKEMIINNPNLFNDFEITKGNLDDCFLNVTGKKLEGK